MERFCLVYEHGVVHGDLRASNAVLVNRLSAHCLSINARGALHAWSSLRPVSSCSWILRTRCGLDGRKIQLVLDWCGTQDFAKDFSLPHL